MTFFSFFPTGRLFTTIVGMLALVFSSAPLIAQTPIAPTTWTGSPASAAGPSAFTTLPATVTPGAAVVNISQWDRAAVVFNAAGGCYNSRDWQVGGSLAAAQAANKNIFFTVTNNATTQLQITSLFIRSQVSATGPQKVQVMYSVGASTVPFGPEIATAHTASPEDWNLPGNVCLGPGQTATFRLYGWGGTGAAGTLRINDGTAIIAGFATPVTAVASNTSPVCAGTPLGFSGMVSGGIPGYTYSWSGPGGFSSTLLNPVITSPLPAASGVYTLTVTDLLGCTTSTTPATTTATVNASPAPITGTMLVCPGLTTTLASTTPGGTWSSSDLAIATVNATTGVVTGITTGTATITYMLGSLCVATATLTVDIPPAALTGSMSLCQGTTTTLGSTTAGGTWMSGTPAVATVSTTGIVDGITTGTATITYTVPGGCIATSVVTVYPFPAPITGTATMCVGSTTTLSNTSAGGTWSSSNATIATVTSGSGIVTGILAGTSNITYMLGGGCASIQMVTVNPLPGTTTGPGSVCVNANISLFNPTPGGTWSSSNMVVATVGSLSGSVRGMSAGTANITFTINGTGCYTTFTVTTNAIPNPITGPAGVCIGSTVVLNTSSSGGTWSSSNTPIATINSAAGTAGGQAAGTAVISYIFNSTGCFITRVQTVHPLPTAITGPSVVCPGLTITLGSTPAGGAWTSSDPTLASVVASSGVVTGIITGTVNITYTLPTGCITTRVTTINPAPPAIITPIGDTIICPGSFSVLTANTGTSLTYQWFESLTPLPGETTATLVTGTSGLYTVRVTNTLGCPRMSAPMSVLVNAVTATITIPGGSTTDCAATPVVLNAVTAAGLSYQWILDGIAIPGATGTTHTAVVSGNYTLFVTNSTGCSDLSAPVAITILPSPSDLVTVSGSLIFCLGSNVVISAETGIGYTYQWHDASGPIAGATGSSYTAATPGSYYCTIVNSYSCPRTTVTSVVGVNPVPDVTITPGGPKAFCAGGFVNLDAAPGAGYGYQWFRNGIAIPGATNMTYVANLTGGYRVAVTDLIGGCGDTTHADTVVTLVPFPVTLPLTPSKFCWGGSALLSTNVSALGSQLQYQWFLNGGAIPGATGNTYSAVVSGNYNCRVTVPGWCVNLSAVVPVTELPLPNPVITFNGTILRTNTFYTAYQWYKNLVPIPGATAYSTVHTGAGNYKVRVTDTNGCQTVSDTYVVTVANNPTGVADAGMKEISIYPNPSQGIVHIDGNGEYTVVVSGMDGRIVIRECNCRSIDVSHLADGVYLLSLSSSDNVPVRTIKLIKTNQ